MANIQENTERGGLESLACVSSVVVSTALAVVFCARALAALYSWVVESHFQLYVNHVSDFGVIEETLLWGNGALVTFLVAFSLRKYFPRKLWVVEKWLFAFVLVVLVLFWIMRRVGGLVTYGEFVSHGV